VKLLGLTIRRMPGFPERGFALPDLSEGLNLIVGPNASGKTTICRAIRGLLWPETLEDDSPVSLIGTWRDGRTDLLLDLEGNRLTCQRDGAPVENPPLPGSHLANCFTVTIDDLFDGSDSDLAERIRHEMAGGYNLRAVSEISSLQVPPRLFRQRSEAVERARAEVREIQAEQEKLQREESTLAEVEEQARDASAARARLQRLGDVQQLLDVRLKIVETANALQAFPPDMERLKGNEEAQFDVMREDLARQVDALGRARAAADEARTVISEADLPEGGISEGQLAEQRERLSALRDTEGRLARAEESLTEIQAEVGRALADLKHVGEAGRLDAIDLSSFNDLESFHRTAEDLAQKRCATEAQIEALGETVEVGSIEQIVQGIGVLREWFESSGATDVDRWNTIITWVLVGVIASVGIALGITSDIWWLILALVAVAAGVAKIMVQTQSANARRMCRERYARLSVPAPAAWEIGAVRKCLRRLEELLAEARFAEHRQVQREPLLHTLVLLDRQQELLDLQRRDLIGRLGVAPDTSFLALVVMAGRLRSYQEAATQRDSVQARAEQLRLERDERTKAVNAFLSAYGLDGAEFAAIAQTRSETLASRAGQHRDARLTLASAERELDAAEEAIGILKQRRRELFEGVGLDDGAGDELENRLARLDDWRGKAATLQDLRNEATRLTERFRDSPNLLETTQAELDAETSRLTALADSYETIVKQVHDIHTRVDKTRGETRLTEAFAAEQDAREALAEVGEAEAFAAAGRFLLDEIETHYEAESQPAVLRQAVTWFGLFARGKYELKVDRNSDDGAVFYARDTTTGRGLSLNQLSRGTRMQLLLALRLAFAAAAEGNTQLPFVLDEVLSSTDPVRFQAIAECLLALVREGRQVFYFTCQPGDAQAWHEVSKQAGIADAVRIDLAKVRDLEQLTSSLLDASTLEIEPVPEPDDMDLAAYSEVLGVPGLEPAAGAGGAHLAHVVRDPRQLCTLLRAGINTYGQLRSLVAHGNVDALIDAAALARVDARGQVLDAFADAWHVGRGRALSREVLAKAGVSDKFIDRVADLARDLDWDAKRLVEALELRGDERVRGFRKAAVEAVRESLMDSRHLDPAEPLDEQAVLARVLAAANEPIKSGALDVDEVRHLFSRFWGLCGTASSS